MQRFRCLKTRLTLVLGLNFISLVTTQHTNSVNSQTRNNSLRQISTSATFMSSRSGHRSQANEELNAADKSGQSTFSTGKLLATANQSQDTNALFYLQRYGYMQAPTNAEANNLISEESFSEAVLSFQRFAGIPETGTIDNQTLRLMRTPRCGNVDKVGQLSGIFGQLRAWPQLITNASASQSEVKRRRKRYALQGSKWRRQELTYRISQYPTRFSGKRHEVDSQIEKAFGIWSQVAPINFVVKKEGRVHIDIRFASGDHGDGDAFDGPGNTLAHAYFPQYGGDAHFDDQEYWTIDSYTGTNIFQVAAHELGHSLGLGHSNVREALMAPFYQKYKPNFKLHVDDVLAIQALYGEKAFLPSSDVPSLSANDIGSSLDSSASHHHHHRHHHQAPSTTTSTSTTTTTTAMPATTTTTMAPSSGPRFLFGGGLPPIDSSSSRFSPFRPSVSLPPSINRHDFGNRDQPTNGAGDHEGNENGIDDPIGGVEPSVGANQSPSSLPADLCSDSAIDAVTRTEDGRSYVFKGDYYWLLTSDGLAKEYPRKISLDWDGLPGSLDAALTWADGKTFFFKGNKYWRFRNKRRDVGYPKLISAGFAGIPDDIDAAFVWSGNGRTYIFKGSEYWRFDSKADPPVSAEYPRSIRVWNGVPFHVNAAFRWENNVTYFFKAHQYYRFNDKDFKVESRGKPPFPRSSAEWWFGCVNTNLAQRSLPDNYFREATTEESGASTNQDTDWSYLAGLEDNTRIMGTHISDHKPTSSVGSIDTSHGVHASREAGYAEMTNRTTTASPPKSYHPTNHVPQVFGGRIGLFNPSRAYSSTAAITSPNYCIHLIALSSVLLWTPHGFLGSISLMPLLRQI